MADETKENIDKKAEKAAKKEEKKAAKAAKKAAKKEGKKGGSDDVFEEEESSSKAAILFVTLIIIVVWLAILALIIKADVGGFGSTVLSPILRDVPYINRILPDTDDDGLSSNSEEASPYGSLDEALARIKELEVQLSDASAAASEDDAQIEELQAEVQRLRGFEENQAAFEELRSNFDQEVVFSENAPDINEYQKYYESIDPTNAEALYRQVLERQQADQELTDYVSMYSAMKASEVATIFDTMTNDLELVAKILTNMDAQTSGAILGQMTPATAARLTQMMEP